MDPIPQPHLLDPDRLLDPQRGQFTADHESRAQMYEDGLHESCAYAQQLWQTLDGVREYLIQSLPPDPRAPGTHVTCASPTGPDDEDGWVRWVDMFSTVTSAMCGPHGDSGYGYGQAREAAQIRRAVQPAPLPTGSLPDQPTREQPATVAADESSAQRVQQAGSAGTAAKRLRLAAGALIGLLAVRGLLPRNRRQDVH